MNDVKRNQVSKKRRPPMSYLRAIDIMMQLIWLEIIDTEVEDLHEAIIIFRKAFK